MNPHLEPFMSSARRATRILKAEYPDRSLLERYRHLRKLAARDVWTPGHAGRLHRIKERLRGWVLPPVSDFNQRLLEGLREQLLQEAVRNGPDERRPRILYVAPFDVISPNGGAARVLGLSRALATRAEVCILSVVGPRREPECIPVDPGVLIYAVPQSTAFLSSVESDRAAWGGAAFSLGLDRHLDQLPLLRYWFRKLGANAATCILNQPYLIRLWREHPSAMRLLYDVPEVNSFFTLRNARGAVDLEDVKRYQAELEQEACRSAEQIGMCSAVDIDTLVKEQGEDVRDKIALLPNGIAVDAAPFFPPAKARELREVCGRARPIAVFLGSPGYPPNIEAVQYMAATLAPRHQELDFVVIGMTEAQTGVKTSLPNFVCCGRVSEAEKTAILCMADIALSPIRSYDSGSSLKIAEYVAHGKPVLATEVGMRGYEELHEVIPPVPIERYADEFALAADKLVTAPQAPRRDKDSDTSMAEALADKAHERARDKARAAPDAQRQEPLLAQDSLCEHARVLLRGIYDWTVIAKGYDCGIGE